MSGVPATLAPAATLGKTITFIGLTHYSRSNNPENFDLRLEEFLKT